MFLFDVIVPTPTPETMSSVADLWRFLPIGYVLTIFVETPVLSLLLPAKVTAKERIFCGVWLTACTYPVVVLVLAPLMMDFGRGSYLLVAEIFAPLAECLLFWMAFRSRKGFDMREWIAAFAVIALANLASFGVGEVLNDVGWFGLF